jgi:hypothetical protein
VTVALISLDGVVLAAHETGGAASLGAGAVGRPVWAAFSSAPKQADQLRLREDIDRAAKGAAVRAQIGTHGAAGALDVHLAPLQDATGTVRFILVSAGDGGSGASPVPQLSDDLAARLVHRINNSVNGVKAALAVLRQAVPPDAQDDRLLQLLDRELDRLADVAREVAAAGARDA